MISRRALLTQLGLIGAVGGGAWWVRDHLLWPAPKAVFADSRSSSWVGFSQPDADVPIVTVSIGGAPVEALLDSGAQSSVIDRGLAQRLGLATTLAAPFIIAFGISGAPQLGRTARLDVGVGGLTLGGLHAAVFDLAAIAAASGRGFGLILGQDVLRHVVAELDFPGARLAFHDPATYTPPAQARAVPVRSDGRELFVPVTVEGWSLEAVIDTGAATTLSLSSATAEAAGLLSGRRVDSAPSITFGGVSQDRVVQAASVGFAGMSLRDVTVHIYTPDRAAPLPPGLLGVEAFGDRRAILDVGRGRFHLAPA